MDGVLRHRGIEMLPAVEPETRAALLVAPADLPAAARALWELHAPHALTERTLTPSTAAGFRQCCQQGAYMAELDARIQQLGPATKEAQPYLAIYIRLAQRLDASLKSFKLTAFGKPATAEKPKPAANPFSQVAG